MRKLMYVTFILITLMMFGIANGHEGHGFKHKEGPIKNIVGARGCQGTQVWYHDHDQDGKVDACTEIIFTHGKIHVRPIPMTNGTCECPKEGD